MHHRGASRSDRVESLPDDIGLDTPPADGTQPAPRRGDQHLRVVGQRQRSALTGDGR